MSKKELLELAQDLLTYLSRFDLEYHCKVRR